MLTPPKYLLKLQHKRWMLLSYLALLCVLGPFALALSALLGQAPYISLQPLIDDAYIQKVIVFTFWQASLSTLLSVLLALPLARALARRQFLGKALLLRVLSIAIVVPPIVAVFGLVVVHGRQGWVNGLLEQFGWYQGSYLYGLVGILLAHVFFNMPLATRILLQRMDAISAEQWRLADQLGMTSWQHWQFIEWPQVRPVLAPLVALIFALCFTSFAIVMSLGGGPQATTLEVAIYQAVRLDFDLPLASLLSLVQLFLCGIILWVGIRLGQPVALFNSHMRFYQRPDSRSKLGKWWDGSITSVALVLVMLPLTGIVLAGVNSQWLHVLNDSQLWKATWNSIWVALCAALLCLFMAWGLLLMRRHTYKQWPAGHWLIESIGMLTLVMPALVLGVGLFLALRQWVNVFSINLPLVIIVNAVLGLPFMLRILSAPYMQVEQQQGRLCQSLGIFGWHRLRCIEWPLLRAPIGLGLAIVAAFSVGDLGVIALFGAPDIKTLPLLMYQRLGSYQADSAAVTAFVLIIVCLAVFTALEKLVGQGLKTRKQYAHDK